MEELNNGSNLAWDPQRVILLNTGIFIIFIFIFLTYHVILFAGMILESV